MPISVSVGLNDNRIIGVPRHVRPTVPKRRCETWLVDSGRFLCVLPPRNDYAAGNVTIVKQKCAVNATKTLASAVRGCGG